VLDREEAGAGASDGEIAGGEEHGRSILVPRAADVREPAVGGRGHPGDMMRAGGSASVDSVQSEPATEWTSVNRWRLFFTSR
jgi:hypothetical protein